MILQDLGIKDLETVCIKTRNDVSFGNRQLEQGEPLLYFENVQVALLSENVRPIMARGGWGNEPLVIWEDRSETSFQFTNGTVTTESLNLLLNADMIERNEEEPVFFVEKDLEIDEEGKTTLKYIPDLSRKIFFFIYDYENIQAKIKPLSINGAEITFDKKYANKRVLCDYYFKYNLDQVFYTMARERFSNLYTLEATFLMKDENDGLEHTGLLRMPKVRIVSDINMRMGERANPAVSSFTIVALPETQRERQSVVCEIRYLDEDITGI